MTDRLAAGLEALDSVVVDVTWADVVARIERPGDDSAAFAPVLRVRHPGRVRWLVAAVVLVALAVAAVVVGSHGSPDTPPSGGPSPTTSVDYNTSDPSGEDYVTPDQVAHLASWLAEYDPAEVAYLQAQVGDTADDLEMVTTLEYRHACRETARARTAALAAVPADRAGVIDAIIDPEIERLRERETSRSETPSMFSDLGTRLKAGDAATVSTWITQNCGTSLDYAN